MDRPVERTENRKSSGSRNNEFFVRGGYFDYQTFFVTLVIVVFGIIMVYSSSSYRGMLEQGNAYYFAIKQAGFAATGIVIMLIVSNINYRYYAKMSKVLMAIAVGLCFYVLIAGVTSHGASRWISLGPIAFQPSEVAKPALIIYVAQVAITKQEHLSNVLGLAKITWPALVCIGLIATENLSTAVVCTVCMLAILFVASPKPAAVILYALILGAFAFLFIKAKGYRGDRLDAWKDPEASETGYQTMQSLYAIGSGGLFGKGLGESIQKLGFLPESHNDMIFSIVCEELGLFGAFAVIALFILLIFNMRRIAYNTVESFGGFVVTGIIAHIASQTFINIGVVTGLLPPTGVTLPFFSYGGTSLLFLLIEMGIVLGISRQSKPLHSEE